MANAFKTTISVKVDQDSYRSLLDRLRQLDRKAVRKAVRDGINEVSKLVLDEAKARVPVRSGQLRKSLGRRVKVARGGAAVYAVVKPRSGHWVNARPGLTGFTRKRRGGSQVFVSKYRIMYRGKMIDPVKYAHLVEYGRREVVTTKKTLSDGTTFFGKRVRSVPPRPFLRPAWEMYKGRAPAIIARFLSRAIDQYWKRSRPR